MTEDLKKTPLAGEHEAAGARMVDFGGWYMPVQYSGLVDEHTAVRTAVGIFDVSHMGEVRVKGKDALAFLQRITTNDVSKLSDGQAQYTVMPNEKGTVIDDLLVYRFGPEHYLLVINASTQDKDFAWISKHAADFDVTVANESNDTGQIAIQGPLAQQVLQRMTETALDEIAYYHFREGSVAGIPALISRTGYTGEDGFECYIPADRAAELWRAMVAEGEPEGLKPAGLGARDTLRLESRMHLYGNDMDETTTVLEAGLGWVTKFKKDGDFIGKDVLRAQKKEGLKRKLIGFEMIGKGIARHDYAIVDSDGNTIGQVTSGSHSPTLGKSIGLGYVATEFSKPETTIYIQVRKKVVEARVVKGAFYSRK